MQQLMGKMIMKCLEPHDVVKCYAFDGAPRFKKRDILSGLCAMYVRYLLYVERFKYNHISKLTKAPLQTATSF